MLDYPLLESLLAIEREGSFEEAAKSMGVTKSAISQKIKLLEQRLGVTTVERNPTRPTNFGRRLCRHLESVLLLESKLFLRYGHLFNTDKINLSSIKVAVDDDTQTRCFLDLLQHHSDIENAVLFDIVIDKNRGALQQLNSHEVKAALSHCPVADPDLNSYHLGAISFIATASPEFVEQHFATGFTPENLQTVTAVSYSASNDLNRHFVSQVFSERLPFLTNYFPSVHGVLNLCSDGHAWGMNPLHLVQDDLKSGQLVDLCPGQCLEVSMYWHISAVIDELLPCITETILRTAGCLAMNPDKKRLLSSEDALNAV